MRHIVAIVHHNGRRASRREQRQYCLDRHVHSKTLNVSDRNHVVRSWRTVSVGASVIVHHEARRASRSRQRRNSLDCNVFGGHADRLGNGF